MHEDLVQIKKMYDTTLPWGQLHAKITEDNVLQLAWRDSKVVLFMSTIGSLDEEDHANRKKPRALDAFDTVNSPWQEKPIAEIAMPRILNQYNHKMGQVDSADQLRSYYTTYTTHHLTPWKAHWY